MGDLSRHRQAAVVVVAALAVWSWWGDSPTVVQWTWPVLALAYVVAGVLKERRDRSEET